MGKVEPEAEGADDWRLGDQPRDVGDVDEAVDGVGGDVLPRGSGRHGQAEVGRQGGDVGNVREGVIVDVGGPGVGAAVSERVGPGRAFDAGAEAVAIGIIGGDRPRRKGLTADG